MHLHDHDPDTDLDLDQDRQNNRHLWSLASSHRTVINVPDNPSDQKHNPQPGKEHDQNHNHAHPRTHHRSLSSASHKLYRSCSCSYSKNSSGCSSNETDSSSCGSGGSITGRTRNWNPLSHTTIRNKKSPSSLPSSSSSSSPLPSTDSSNEKRSTSGTRCLISCNSVCTGLGILLLFLLTWVLVMQFSSDVRSSAMQISHLFSHTTSSRQPMHTDSTVDDNNETFNQQVTSRIISLILPSDAVIRRISGGSSLLGFKVKESGQEVHVFLGVPYARPPIGRLRFAKPSPMPAWNGLRDATRFGPQCLQFKPNATTVRTPWINREDSMSEDCLTLNIWTPVKRGSGHEQDKLLPVMVWLHGGAFFSGSTDLPLYDGRTLSSMGNVVVVTINYRLGVFGFLDGRSADAPGNQGLHDQVMALHWIQDNIGYFGGDRESVTLFGQSAGAISIGLHYLSPLSRGLFKRGILQSGSPTVSRLFYERDPSDPHDVKNRMPKLAFLAGCINDTRNYADLPLSQIISCLKNTDVDVLSAAQNSLIQELSLSFGPSVGDDFLPDLPINMLHNVAAGHPDAKDTRNSHKLVRRRRQANESLDSDYGEDYEEDEANSDLDNETGSGQQRNQEYKRSSWNGSVGHILDHKEVMMGVNADEGSYFLHYLDPVTFAHEPMDITHAESLAFIQKQFNFLPPHLTKVLTDLFLSSDRRLEGNDSSSSASHAVRQSLAHFISDSTFTCPATLFAHMASGLGIDTYFYLFDHKTGSDARPGGKQRPPSPDWMGVMHFDEVPYVFGHPIRDPSLYSEQEVRLSRDMMNAWTSFARSG